MRAVCVASSIAAAYAGSVEFVSGDFAAGDRKLGNVKATWSQGFKVGGRATKLTAKYDRDTKENWLSEVSLTGALDKVKYELSRSGSGTTDVKLGTDMADGTSLEAEGNFNDLAGSVTKLTASRAAKVLDRDCDLELSHDLSASESKLKLSSALGSGLKAIGTLTSKGGSSNLAYEVEYDTTLSEGRTLSASFNPQAGTGEVEYEDSATLGEATVSAKFPLGGKPSVEVKRSFDF